MELTKLEILLALNLLDCRLRRGTIKDYEKSLGVSRSGATRKFLKKMCDEYILVQNGYIEKLNKKYVTYKLNKGQLTRAIKSTKDYEIMLEIVKRCEITVITGKGKYEGLI